MATYVGLDRARTGWFGVILREDGTWNADLFPSIWSVWKYHSDAARILVDVPIGLPATARRDCDVAAKRALAPHHGRTFYAPTRAAVYEDNLETARAVNERAGFSIQNRTWSVVPHIREVDEFLDMYPGARDRLRETHPEVCFYGLNDRQAVEPPRDADAGRRRRLALLSAASPDADAIYEACLDRFATPSYAPAVSRPGVVLGALVAAVTARRDEAARATLPETDPPQDARALPMRIVYPVDTVQARLTTLTDDP